MYSKAGRSFQGPTSSINAGSDEVGLEEKKRMMPKITTPVEKFCWNQAYFKNNDKIQIMYFLNILFFSLRTH
jgi:hypothetical protein